MTTTTDQGLPSDLGGPTRRGIGIAAVLSASVLWSFGGVLGRSTGATGEVLSFWRMWVATAVMVVIVGVTRRFPSWTDIRRAAPLGVLFGLNICAFFISLEYVSIAVAVVIGSLTPVVALPIAVRFLGERPDAIKIGCALVAVGGAVVAVLAASESSSGDTTATGYFWAVISLHLWVAYLLLSKRVRRRIETVRFMCVTSGAGALTVSAVVIVLGADLGEVSGTGWWWVILLAISPGILGHGLVAWAHPRVGSSVSSLLIQVEPVGAAMAAWAFLGQRVSFVQGVAMLIVLVTLGFLASREARESDIDFDTAMG